MTDADDLRTVRLIGVPIALGRRSTEHHATLMRELALIEAAEDQTTVPGRLLALSSEVQSKYARFGATQREQVQAAAAAGEDAIDLSYVVPADLADDIDQLAALLEEAEQFCRSGDLVTLVAPADVVAYREWVFGQFRRQLRGTGAAVPWTGPSSGVVADVTDGSSRPGRILIAEDLDLEGAARAREEIAQRLEQGVTDLRVDLARCDFVDSVGISLLLTTLARVRESGGSLVLENVTDSIRRTLHHAGILDLLMRD